MEIKTWNRYSTNLLQFFRYSFLLVFLIILLRYFIKIVEESQAPIVRISGNVIEVNKDIDDEQQQLEKVQYIKNANMYNMYMKIDMYST